MDVCQCLKLMVTKRTATQVPSAPTTPESFDRPSTPTGAGFHDHSFTLQALMELQRSTGELSAAIRSTTDAIEKLDAKVDRLEDKLSGVTHKIYAAGVVLAILVAVGAFVVDKAWDLMATQITANK